MNFNFTTIWSSFEVDCMSRDFNHEQYTAKHAELGVTGQALTEEKYNAIDKALFNFAVVDGRS